MGEGEHRLAPTPYRMLQWMIVIVVGTAIVSFVSIQRPPEPVYEQVGSVSPYGYTISLVLFVVPVAFLFTWFYKRRQALAEHWRAFWVTFLIIVGVWSLLDVLLANTIFEFPNEDATVGFDLPGYDPETGWGFNVPIEEFVFYISGCAIIVLLYVWSSETWYRHYTQDAAVYREFGSEHLFLRKLFHGRSLLVGIGLVAAGFLAKQLGPTPEGWPIYFTFLVLVVITPTAMCFEAVVRFINLRAFLFTIQALLAVSILWEVTLGLPYGWWGYEQRNMLGWFITPWSELPIEAPLLWLAAAWSNVGVYEVAKIFYSVKERRWREVITAKEAASVSPVPGGEGSRWM